MSIAEIASEIPAGCYSYTFPALVPGGAGVIQQSPADTNANYLASGVKNFIPGTSQIVGAVRTTAGGTVCTPCVGYAVQAGSVSGAVVVMKVMSQNPLDSSVYTVFWTQKVAQSNVKAILPC